MIGKGGMVGEFLERIIVMTVTIECKEKSELAGVLFR